MSKPGRACLLSVLALVLLSGVSRAEEASPVASHPMIGEAAPGFSLSTTAGDSLRLTDLKGRYVVIHFGASW